MTLRDRLRQLEQQFQRLPIHQADTTRKFISALTQMDLLTAGLSPDDPDDTVGHLVKRHAEQAGYDLHDIKILTNELEEWYAKRTICKVPS